MTIRDHAAALRTLLDGATGLVYFDGLPPAPEDAPRKYAVLYLTTPSGTVKRQIGISPAEKYTASVLYVGATANECRWVAEKVQAAFNNVRPVVAGRICTSLGEPTSGAPVRPDLSTRPPVANATDVWQFASTPAA